jgi:hypothetical protein
MLQMLILSLFNYTVSTTYIVEWYGKMIKSDKVYFKEDVVTYLKALSHNLTVLRKTMNTSARTFCDSPDPNYIPVYQ